MTSNKVNKPVMMNREQNSVLISWKNVDSLRNIPNILQIKDDLKRWRTIYWGSKDQFQIKNLTPCTCYNLRMKGEDANEWLEFRAATSDGPYLVMHMTRAIKFGKTPLIRKIAHSRPHLLETENKEMKTPLIQSVEKGDASLVNLLINLGANVNTVTAYNLRSPLMVAVALGHLSIANLLIDKGSNVKATDVNGLNILHYAVDSNNVENVKYALAQQPCVNDKDYSGWTPLLRAVILNCDQEIIHILLKNGADRSLKDKNGFDFDKHKQMLEFNN